MQVRYDCTQEEDSMALAYSTFTQFYLGMRSSQSAANHGNTRPLPYKVKMQYVDFREHANYFLLPWQIREELSWQSMLFNK